MDVEKGLTLESTPLLKVLGHNGANSAPSSFESTQQADTDSIVSSTRSIESIIALPGMKIRAHAIGKKKGEILPCRAKEALQNAKSGNRGHYWIDIDADARDTDELRSWLAQLKLSSFFRSRLAEPPDSWSSQVIPLPKASLSMIRILPDYNTTEKNSTDNPFSDEITHIAALNLPNLLVTFTSCDRSETGGLYDQVLQCLQHQHDERIPDKSSSGALLAWLQWHMERTNKAARNLRYHVLQMDAAMDRSTAMAVHIQEIIQAKDELLRILSVAEEQIECVEALAVAEKDTQALDFSQLRGRVGVLQATAGATARMTLRLEKHLADLRHRHDSHQHDRLNRRLAVLTILSAIFLPLTLITGIWGMNFAYMPELQGPDAYPIALVFMATLAMSMICYFQRTGWFQ